jgi:hypothetical protein
MSFYYNFNIDNTKQRKYEIISGYKCSKYFNKKIFNDNNLDDKYDILLEDNISIEVKTHFQFTKFKTWFIEFSYKNRPSGIRTSQATYYCLNDTINYYLIKTDILKKIIEDNILLINISKPNDNTLTIGYKIPMSLIIDNCTII